MSILKIISSTARRIGELPSEYEEQAPLIREIDALLTNFHVNGCGFTMPKILYIGGPDYPPLHPYSIKFSTSFFGKKSSVTTMHMIMACPTSASIGGTIKVSARCTMHRRSLIYRNLSKNILYKYCCDRLAENNTFAEMHEAGTINLTKSLFDIRSDKNNEVRGYGY